MNFSKKIVSFSKDQYSKNEKKKFWVCEAKSSGINRDLGTHTQGQRFSQSRTLFYIEPRGGKLWFLCCWLLVLKAIKNKEEICKVLKESTTTNIGTAYREFLVTNLSKHLTIFQIRKKYTRFSRNNLQGQITSRYFETFWQRIRSPIPHEWALPYFLRIVLPKERKLLWGLLWNF